MSYWKVYDFIPGTIIPHPEYKISTINSVNLRPDEEKQVNVEIKSPVNLLSDVALSSISNQNLVTNFIPSRISISPLGTGSTTLLIKTLQNATSSNILLPITARVSFPEEIQALFGSSSLPLSNLTQSETLSINILPKEPLKLDIPWEALAGIYGLVISAVMGWSIPSIASWINETKRRRHFLEFITMIDKTYDKLGKDENQFSGYLDTVKRDLEYALGRGKISESQYNLLINKITKYYNGK